MRPASWRLRSGATSKIGVIGVIELLLQVLPLINRGCQSQGGFDRCQRRAERCHSDSNPASALKAWT
ncbi:MAG: hypothetical protein C1943_16340 [Halochromatium sp.]|nr:hypothetical protein [Halochromatium sp.]